MSKVRWTKAASEIGGIREVSWIASDIVTDEYIATAYKGGDRYYPWSASMPGHRIGNASTLGSMKAVIEAEYAKERAA